MGTVTANARTRLWDGQSRLKIKLDTTHTTRPRFHNRNENLVGSNHGQSAAKLRFFNQEAPHAPNRCSSNPGQ